MPSQRWGGGTELIRGDRVKSDNFVYMAPRFRQLASQTPAGMASPDREMHGIRLFAVDDAMAGGRELTRAEFGRTTILSNMMLPR
jgi:hypothetical protein